MLFFQQESMPKGSGLFAYIIGGLKLVVIVFPFQSIGVQLIEITIMFENSLFFGGVLIILKLDLMTLQYGILDTINDVINFFVMWLDSTRNCSQTLKLLGL